MPASGLLKAVLRALCPAVLIGFLALSASACAPKAHMQTVEELAQSIDKGLICPVCPGETIDQSQAQLAVQMRGIVREKLQEGWSREQVQQYFVERYGPSVLAEPPKSGFHLLAWAAPPVALLLGVVVLTLVLRGLASHRRPAEAQSSAAEGDPRMKEYVKRVEEEVQEHPTSTEVRSNGSGLSP